MRRKWTAVFLSAVLSVSAGSIIRLQAADAASDPAADQSSGQVTEKEMTEGGADALISDNNAGFAGRATIDSTVLVDEKDVKITASNLAYESYQTTIDLLIENNTSQDLSFTSGTMAFCCNSVNGYAISSMYVNEDVTAGMKKNTEVSIRNDELEFLGIKDIAEIEMGFRVETEDYDDYLVTAPVKIQTSSAASVDLTEDTYQKGLSDGSFERISGGKVEAFQKGSFYSADGINLISAAIVKKDGTDAVLLELENTTDQVLSFHVGDFAINNLVISSPFWDSITLNPHGRAVMAENIDNMADAKACAAFGIGQPQAIAFHATISDSQNNDLTENGQVSISFGDSQAVNQDGAELYNQNGIRVLYKGVSDDSLYSYLLLTIFNDSSDTIYVSDETGSTSVNGFMVDENTYSRTIEPGQAGGMMYGISKGSLEENQITAADITTATFQLNIGSGSYYNYIDQPKLTVNVK
jgi:hypothetical protein